MLRRTWIALAASAASRAVGAPVRKPLEVARQLGAVYGHKITDVVYTQTVALIGRLRLGDVADVERVLDPWVSGGKPGIAKPNGSGYAGHLVFAALARRTKKPRYSELVRAAADLALREPAHNEMSDAVFMVCPLLAEAGRLTSEAKYFDTCVSHAKFMRGLDLRPDGIYRHSPLCEAAWGRGNGFPALGLALALSAFPDRHAGRPDLLAAFQAHLTALLRHQDANGAWHQVIDVPASYAELTATCMITTAMIRGVRRRWLDRRTFQPAIDRAWQAITHFVAANGDVTSVCPSTGKLKTLEAYLNRTPVSGRDDRGGSMALLVATEMAGRPEA